MKILLSGSLLFVSVVIISCLPSCTKEKIVTEVKTDTVTVTIRDTVNAIPLTATQILSKYKWEVYESFQIIHGLKGDDTTHYLKGVVNTVGGGVEIQRLTFNANGTGTYIGGDGLNYTATWLFTTPDQQNMKLVTTYGSSSATYNWNLISIKDSAIYQTTAAYPGTLISSKWIPTSN